MKLLYVLVAILSMAPVVTYGDEEVPKNNYNGWLDIGFIGYNWGDTMSGLGAVVEASLQRNKSIVAFSVDSFSDEGIFTCFPFGCSDGYTVHDINSSSILYGKSFKNDQIIISTGLSYLKKSAYYVKSKKSEIVQRGYGIPVIVTVRSKKFKYIGSAFQFRAKISDVQSYISTYLIFEFGVRR